MTDGDNRLCPRFLFSVPVSFSSPQVSVNGSIAGNLSLSGMSLKVQGFVPVGAILELQLRLGESPKVIWVKGQVVRVRQTLADECYEIGLKFIRDEEVIKAVGAYISAIRSGSFKKEH